VTIAGDPGSSIASATNSNAISAKPTTAKKVKAGTRSDCTQLNTRSNVPFPKTQARKKGSAEGTLRRDLLWTLAGKLPTGLRDKVPFQECQGQRPPTVLGFRVPVPISGLRPCRQNDRIDDAMSVSGPWADITPTPARVRFRG